MSALLLILLGAVLVSHFALTRIPALRPFMGDTDEFDAAVGFALTIAASTVVVTLLSHALDVYVLHALHLDYLRPMLFLTVVMCIALIAESLLLRDGRWMPRRPGFLLLMTTNGALLGVPLMDAARAQALWETVRFGVGTALSFAAMLLAFTALQQRLRHAAIPAVFREAPVALITAGIMSLAFMGFTGLIQE